MGRFIVTTTVTSYVEAESEKEALELIQDLESEICLETIKHSGVAVENVKSALGMQV